MGKNNRMTINWEEYVLHKHIPKNLMDTHHIISRQLVQTFNVNNPKNKVEMQRRKHVHLNWLYGSHQTPKEQLKDMVEIWKTALSEEVRSSLYDILSLDDEFFYDYDLVKKHKTLKNKIW